MIIDNWQNKKLTDIVCRLPQNLFETRHSDGVATPAFSITCPPFTSSINTSTLTLHKSSFTFYTIMKNISIITFSIVILFSSFVANGIPGGRTKVTDVKSNKELQELGKYSVEEYNRLQRISSGKNDGDLTFLKVVEAEKQVVSGMKYYLKIEVVSKKSEDPKVFEAVVVVKPWLRSKQLQSFSPSSSVISQLIWWCFAGTGSEFATGV